MVLDLTSGNGCTLFVKLSKDGQAEEEFSSCSDAYGSSHGQACRAGDISCGLTFGTIIISKVVHLIQMQEERSTV